MKLYQSFAFFVCLAMLAGCTAKPQPARPNATATPKATPRPQPSPTLGAVSVRAERSGASQVSIVVVGHGRKLYRILADSNDSRRASNGTYTSHFTKPTIVFFNEDGGQMKATARTADADGATKIVTLHDDVHVVTADGSVLTCDQFTYDEIHNHVHGFGHVKVVTKQGDTLHGQNLTGDVKLSSVHVDG